MRAFSGLVLLIMMAQISHAEIVIAIIDTGCDLKHSALQDFIWKNPGEIAGNGIDDDQNGYVDDLHGWDFTLNSQNVQDKHGHGTHIAGLIARENSPKKIKLMVLKYFSPHADNLKTSVAALKYAIDNGAQIINYSGGGYQYSAEEYSLLKLAAKKNILLIAAAGNESLDLNQSPFFPANYKLSNIITVAAYNQAGRLLKHSNYNLKEVDVAALGEGVTSTLPLNKQGSMTGTSQATAIVTGQIANFWQGQGKGLPSLHLKNQFLRQLPRDKNLLGKVKYGTYLENH